jgi:hypothetical protein
MRITKRQLRRIIKEELAKTLTEQDFGAPEDHMGAYAQGQAAAGVQTAYDEAWATYTVGMQDIYDRARDLGITVKKLWSRVNRNEGDEAELEPLRRLMLFTSVSGHYGGDNPTTLQGTITDFMQTVDDDLKKQGSRGPTSVDYVKGNRNPRG